jgi:hypothetical protein
MIGIVNGFTEIDDDINTGNKTLKNSQRNKQTVSTGSS